MANSDLNQFKDKAAICGVGRIKVHRREVLGPEDDVQSEVFTAFKNALEDSGLSRDDIDGIYCHNLPEELAFDHRLPQVLGLKNVRYANDYRSHGRVAPTILTTAAMAVTYGLANYVACFRTSLNLAGFRQRNATEGGTGVAGAYGSHLEFPEYGGVGPHIGAAMSLQRYLLKYGYTHKELGAVAVSQRKWACLNPDAYFYGRPITIGDYLNSRFIVKPLKLYDCSLPGGGAFCMIVTTAERARNLKKPPIYLSGVQGSTSGSHQFIFGRQGLGIGMQEEYEYKAPLMPCYKMAGIKPQDVDMVGLHDAFSPNVFFGLEAFGFCKDGEGLAFVQGGTIEPGGKLPVNTNGGHMSDIHASGWGQMVEIVRQLRGECGPRQVPNAEIGQYFVTDLGSVVFRK